MTEMIRRDIELEIVKWLDNKEIIAIRGPRQCGKTTFLKRLKEILKSEKVSFVSFEDMFEKEKFEKNPKDYITSLIEPGSFNYILFDEVQYVKDAGKLLKLVYDSFDDVKIIITGSSTLDLNEVGSYLVGRVLLFEMRPFSFNEFLKAKDEKLHKYYDQKKICLKDRSVKNEEIIFLKELNERLKEYITYGGYPAVVLEDDINKKKFLLKNLFQTYVEKDIVKLYGYNYKQRIIDLVRYLASINGALINYNEIASSISLYDKEIKAMLSMFEETYIIRRLRPFHKNMKTELKKNPKIYFMDTGLRNVMNDRFDFSKEEYGILLENYVLNKFTDNKVNYWRTTAKAEVDFVVDETIPIESKSRAKITRSFLSFLDTYKPETAFLLNLDDLSEKKINNTKVIFAPTVLFDRC